MLSYNQIIGINREFANKHFVLKNFGNGQKWKITQHNQKSSFKYPIMWMEDLQSSSPNKIFSLSFRIHFLGQVSDLKKRENDLMTTNENEVKSDMIQCAQDLISFWVQDTLYPTLDIGRNFNITTLENELDNTVTGCYVDITFNQSNSYNSCIIPMSGMPPPPSVACEPVVITINGDAYATVQSGGSKAILVQYENGNNVGVINGDIIKIPNPIIPINSSTIFKTGSAGTLNQYDDGWFQNGRGIGWDLLEFDNHFGHNFAYTGLTGGYYDHITSQYKDVDGVVTTEALAFPDKLIISWKSFNPITGDFFVMSYDFLRSGTNASMISSAGAGGYTVGAFSGFYVCNVLEMLLYYRWGGTGLNYPPISYIVGTPTVLERVCTSTAASTSYEALISFQQINAVSPTASYTTFIGRYLNLTDI